LSWLTVTVLKFLVQAVHVAMVAEYSTSLPTRQLRDDA
jgi:hypothetical protein